MGILLFELFRNPLFMGILNKWETLVRYTEIGMLLIQNMVHSRYANKKNLLVSLRMQKDSFTN